MLHSSCSYLHPIHVSGFWLGGWVFGFRLSWPPVSLALIFINAETTEHSKLSEVTHLPQQTMLQECLLVFNWSVGEHIKSISQYTFHFYRAKELIIIAIFFSWACPNYDSKNTAFNFINVKPVNLRNYQICR